MNILQILVPSECDKLKILMYEELGCQPVYQDGQSCPIYYNCGEYTTDANTCNYQGHRFKKGEKLDNGLTYESCSIACTCKGG